jgi:hypothetical protein
MTPSSHVIRLLVFFFDFYFLDVCIGLRVVVYRALNLCSAIVIFAMLLFWIHDLSSRLVRCLGLIAVSEEFAAFDVALAAA